MSYTEPLLSIVLILGLVGALRLPKCRGRNLVFAALAGLFLISWPPLDWVFSRPLEVWYPVRPAPEASADAIVVLSASVDPPQYDRPFAVAGQDTYRRCLAAAWLYRHWKQVPVLACGGPNGRHAPFSVTMREVLESEGVPESGIWTEERSRTTYENALYGAAILRNHGISRIALVVDAQSMPRAAACFRKQGIAVVPAPSEFREWGAWQDEAFPNWHAVRRNEISLHEMAGLIWYKLHGRI